VQDSGVTQHLSDVHFTDANNGWITSSFGTLLHTTDGGDTWTVEDPGTTHSLSAIHFIDSQNGWICGGNNTNASILHTSDGGTTWNPDDPGTSDYLYGIYLTDATHGWAVGIHGHIVSTIPTTNTPPNKPSNPIPSDGATDVYTNPTLSVIVNDPNSETMTVTFYNASNNNLIGTNNNVASGTRAYIIWNYLSKNTTYSWYAVADDGKDSNQSEIWTFSTGGVTNNPNEVNITLHIGWNLIGWYHPYDTTASSLAENITDCALVSIWNTTADSYDNYIPGIPESDYVIERGIGIFIWVDSESTWHGEG
jgi:hypothetical protein